MISFRSGRSNQGMAPAIASTTINTALWLRSAPLANALAVKQSPVLSSPRLNLTF
ncbi:hypothetical protein EC54115_14172 [Escherichia coli 541-15]|nr:hypothetical protein EC54115_14172 [Escherichia coli 541-15]